MTIEEIRVYQRFVGDWANFQNWPNLVPHDLLLYSEIPVGVTAV